LRSPTGVAGSQKEGATRRKVAPMTQASLGKRRGQGEDSIYWDASKNRFVGAVSLGFSPSGTRIRKKVVGRTKTEVRDKLKELHKQVESGLRPRRRYTVGDALDDWLAVGVNGLSARTVTLYRDTIGKALREELGTVRLTDLTAGDVQGALAAQAARLSSRTVQIAHNVLLRAIRQAERDDLVGRNVAALVRPPKGQGAGRPSKSLTLGQAVALMAAARGTRLEAYITLSLLTGLRTEEARALRWDHVMAWVAGQWEPVSEAGFDREQLAVFVWRADRAGSDTKTPKSRRTLALPRRSVEALREHRVRQAEDRLVAGPDATLAGVKVSEILRLIGRDGWYLDRQKGSHRQYKHPSKRGLVTVSGKPSDDLHPKTRDSILRQAGLNEDGSQADAREG